ncbi:predicted protein [Postia placenta Mad-698-R]|nr:predicted protein [Postia placenta Mad-698-R]
MRIGNRQRTHPQFTLVQGSKTEGVSANGAVYERRNRATERNAAGPDAAPIAVLQHTHRPSRDIPLGTSRDWSSVDPRTIPLLRTLNPDTPPPDHCSPSVQGSAPTFTHMQAPSRYRNERQMSGFCAYTLNNRVRLNLLGRFTLEYDPTTNGFWKSGHNPRWPYGIELLGLLLMEAPSLKHLCLENFEELLWMHEPLGQVVTRFRELTSLTLRVGWGPILTSAALANVTSLLIEGFQAEDLQLETEVEVEDAPILMDSWAPLHTTGTYAVWRYGWLICLYVNSSASSPTFGSSSATFSISQ